MAPEEVHMVQRWAIQYCAAKHIYRLAWVVTTKELTQMMIQRHWPERKSEECADVEYD
jgi:hypothetical protein